MLSFWVSSCRKDEYHYLQFVTNEDSQFEFCAGAFDHWSSHCKMAPEQEIPISFLTQFEQHPADPYVYDDVRVNPNNPYQIIYYRKKLASPLSDAELWSFNFCTGDQIKIADDISSPGDYSRNDWILYTTSSNELILCKSNGDSSKTIAGPGSYIWPGRFSPNGKLFFYNDGDYYWVKKLDGSAVYQSSFTSSFPIAWKDDSTLVILAGNGGFREFSLNNHQTITTNNHISEMVFNYGFTYDRTLNVVYEHCVVKSGSDQRLFLRFDLNNNTLDTIKEIKNNHVYKSGIHIPQFDIIICPLIRREFKDSTHHVVLTRMNLIIMNTDCKEEQLLIIPE
ncbi:MAG: hypothetical protein IPM74_16395 [Crocinitomicaceae bacterium]|nr:hypothetical protein [Crocinitomicaceae bacterium]